MIDSNPQAVDGRWEGLGCEVSVSTNSSSPLHSFSIKESKHGNTHLFKVEEKHLFKDLYLPQQFLQIFPPNLSHYNNFIV